MLHNIIFLLYFLERTERGETITYALDQHELDKANKDKKNKFFPPGFRVGKQKNYFLMRFIFSKSF